MGSIKGLIVTGLVSTALVLVTVYVLNRFAPTRSLVQMAFA
jgi:hypothetical protein